MAYEDDDIEAEGLEADNEQRESARLPSTLMTFEDHETNADSLEADNEQ